MSKLRVAIIGAGGAGLAICQCLENEPQIEHVVYERASSVGGTWRYTKNDKNQINTPMYKNLRTNLAKEIMAYPDFPFPKHLPSFLPTEEVGKYLKDYADHFDLMKSIRVDHEVVSVQPMQDDDGKQTWKVVVKNLRNDTIHTNVFDAVVVCNGHLEVPRLPEISGINTFPGTVMHSVDYDKPEDYQDQVVAILGARSSGVDIAMDLSKFAKKIYLIHLGEKSCTFKYPDNVEEISGTITACLSNGHIEIANGETRYADVVIFCTGYLQTLPFLDPKCGINVSQHSHVTPLYKHIFNIQYPSMSFIGICVRLCPFPNYALQAKLVCSVLAGRTTLPSKEEMLRDEQEECQKRIEAGMAKNMMHVLGVDYQMQYCETIAELAGVPCTYTPVIHSLYSHINAIRPLYLDTYRMKNFEIDGDKWKEV